MNSHYLYETVVQWAGGRRGVLGAAGMPAIDVAAPPEFSGDDHTWTPEHLFVGAVNSCYMATFAAIADASKLKVMGFTATATGTLKKLAEGGYRITEIVLKPALLLENEADAERAARLLEKALKHCFISNSIASNVKLSPEISVARTVTAG